MKFRYFLRGLGVGILFASILLLAAYRDNVSSNRLSDAEIKKKARALGMVEADSMIGSLLTEQNSSEENKVDSESESKKEIDTSGGTENQDGQDDAEEEDIDKETGSQNQDDSSEQADESDTAKPGGTVVISIERGDSSFPICQRLQALGMIDNASEFDSYMVENGYASRIRVGTHKLTKGMSFKEIAEAISDPL